MPSMDQTRLSMQWEDEGKKRRVTGITAGELVDLLKVKPEALQKALDQLATRTSNGKGETTEAERERRRAYNERRKAQMTPEQKAKEAERRKAYNKKRAEQVRTAMALLREQEHSNGATAK